MCEMKTLKEQIELNQNRIFERNLDKQQVLKNSVDMRQLFNLL